MWISGNCKEWKRPSGHGGRINGVRMGKKLYIAEKPSVAREFAKALKLNMSSRDGYMESQDAVVTWCVGHLVTMSYPEAYDEKLKAGHWKRFRSFLRNLNMK